MKVYLEKIASGEDLTRSEAAQLLETILQGEAAPAAVGAALLALRTKGESASEIAGFVDVLEQHMITVPLQDPDALDVCGTGGDGQGTFNVSTTVALVLAGGGITVAKHGNRAVSSSCGSADVLEALGIQVDLSPQAVQTCINEIGIGFFFAPRFHPAFKMLAPIRRQLGVRTIFNLLGPLLNPGRVKRQLIGAFSEKAAVQLANALALRGVKKACTLHSQDGYDEISPFARTHLYFVSDRSARPYQTFYQPLQAPKETLRDQIAGGTARENARRVLDILKGQPGPARDMVLYNAALGFLVADRVSSMEEGIRLAGEVIDQGLAMKKLIAWREASCDLAERSLEESRPTIS